MSRGSSRGWGPARPGGGAGFVQRACGDGCERQKPAMAEQRRGTVAAAGDVKRHSGRRRGRRRGASASGGGARDVVAERRRAWAGGEMRARGQSACGAVVAASGRRSACATERRGRREGVPHPRCRGAAAWLEEAGGVGATARRRGGGARCWVCKAAPGGVRLGEAAPGVGDDDGIGGGASRSGRGGRRGKWGDRGRMWGGSWGS
nr:circumsporozoite protein-like [Aegilops tauschii subsp. strangulata]